MKKNVTQIALAAIATLSSIAFAQTAPPTSSRVTTQFQSPNGITENCIAIEKLPLGEYSKKDTDEEQRLCAFDFYNDSVALCPKTWSTSPGTIIRGFAGMARSSADAESRLCSNGTKMSKLAKFKQTMNQPNTSGTFSAASILYYHFSRALDANVKVPVAVYRSMDAKAHLDRVTSVANPPANARMNVAGWGWITQGEQNPAAYSAANDLFTADRKQIYGTLLKDKGERYGVEVNGTRESGWGKGQNYDFQATPGFAALKAEGDLNTAIQNGYSTAIQNPKMKAAFASGTVRKVQMVLWMNELSEIASMDYIFSQQDRVGNLDYKWYWTYVDAQGEMHADSVDDEKYESLSRSRMGEIKAPAAIADRDPILVQKTFMGDNDAGGLIQYANFTKSTGMLEGIKHLNKDFYQRLQKLAKDFKTKGANFQVLNRESRMLGYTDRGDARFNQMIGNTILAAGIFEKNCRAGALNLDLVSFKNAIKGNYESEPTNCVSL